MWYVDGMYDLSNQIMASDRMTKQAKIWRHVKLLASFDLGAHVAWFKAQKIQKTH